MLTLSITVTAGQAARIEAALRKRFGADPDRTLPQIAQAFVIYQLKKLVLESEDAARREAVEAQIPPIPEF